MNKTELIAKLAQMLNVSKKAASDMLNGFITVVVDSVAKGDAVRIQGFGTFARSRREAKTGVNPQNPSQKIKIPAMNVATFKVGSEFKAAVRNSK